MSIQTELTRITNAKAAIKAAIEGNGVTVPDGTLLDGMAALIESIEAGGGGGSGTGSGYATGTYTVASDITIGTDISKALKIDTGLSEVKIFAFSKNLKVSTTSNYELLSGIWVYNNGDYYGIRYHKTTSSNSAYFSQNANNQYSGNAFYNEGNGVMSIKGCTTSTKIYAGTEYVWFAI